MQNRNVECLFIRRLALVLLREDVCVRICKGEIARVVDSIDLLVLQIQIVHQSNHACSFFRVFSLLRFKSLANLSILPADHFNVFHAYPELCRWFGG